MEEYEYSFKVTTIKPYIEYCKKNDYSKIEEFLQESVIYKNDNKIMARITTNERNGNKKIILDFKDDNESETILKVCRETLPLEITDNNVDAVYSILDMLGYTIKKKLIRTRFIYYKDDVTFELDKYSSPEKIYVVGIEGKKQAVDKVYNMISKEINNIIED